MSQSIREKAKQLINSGDFSCIAAKDEKIIFSKQQRGILPLIDLNDYNPETLSGAQLFDKIIGRAAAMIAVNCGCFYVYGEVMSQGAFEILAKNNIAFEYGTQVKIINNRENTGMCPIEESVLNIENPMMACKAIREKTNFLMNKAFKENEK